MDRRVEDWKSFISNFHEAKIERLKSENRLLDSKLTAATRLHSEAKAELEKLTERMSKFAKDKEKSDDEAAENSRLLALMTRAYEQRELDLVVLEDQYATLQRRSQQIGEDNSRLQMDVDMLREQLLDGTTEVQLTWAEAARLEQQVKQGKELLAQVQQSNDALAGVNDNNTLEIASLKQDMHNFIRIMGLLTGLQLDTNSWNTAFLGQFADLVTSLTNQGRLQNNDPLVFSIWEPLACTDEMSNGMLREPTNMLEQKLGGRWRALSGAMRAGYTHITEEAISNLFGAREYFRAPGLGVLLGKDCLTGRRWYIVLDFNPSAHALRVMDGSVLTIRRLETDHLPSYFVRR